MRLCARRAAFLQNPTWSPPSQKLPSIHGPRMVLCPTAQYHSKTTLALGHIGRLACGVTLCVCGNVPCKDRETRKKRATIGVRDSRSYALQAKAEKVNGRNDSKTPKETCTTSNNHQKPTKQAATPSHGANRPQVPLPSSWKVHVPQVELKQVCRYLYRKTSHDVRVIIGPEGVGKSCLLRKAITDMQDGTFVPTESDTLFRPEDDIEINWTASPFLDFCHMDLNSFDSFDAFLAAFECRITQMVTNSTPSTSEAKRRAQGEHRHSPSPQNQGLTSSQVFSLVKGENKNHILAELAQYARNSLPPSKLAIAPINTSHCNEEAQYKLWTFLVDHAHDLSSQQKLSGMTKQRRALILALHFLQKREERTQSQVSSARESAEGAKPYPDNSKRFKTKGQERLKVLLGALHLMTSKNNVDCKIVLHGYHKLLEWGPEAANYHDALLLPYKYSSADKPKWVPMVIEVDSNYYNTHLNNDLMSANFRFIEVQPWSVAETQRYLSPQVTRQQANIMDSKLGGHPHHLRRFLPFWHSRPETETLEESLREFVLGRVKEDFDRKLAHMWKTDIMQQYKDQRHPDLFHIISYIDRMRETRFRANYGGEHGDEFLEIPLTEAMLQANILHKQREPYYVKPANRAFQELLYMLAEHHKERMTPLQFLKYRLYHRFQGTVPLSHLSKSDEIHYGDAPGTLTHTPS